MLNEPAKIKSHKDLLIWQRGMELVARVYRMTKTFPEDEKFGLSSQMRRAAVSIPSNIAEGQARRSTKEFAQFLSHAEGSAAELDTHLSAEFGYCSPEAVRETSSLICELQKMIGALRRKLVVNVS